MNNSQVVSGSSIEVSCLPEANPQFEPQFEQPVVHCERCHPYGPGDDGLVQRCLAGDDTAWAELIARYRTLVLSISRRFGASSDDAADILQCVFVEVFNSLAQLKKAESFRSWLITVTVRQSIRWRRSYAREVPLESVDQEAKEISVAAPMPGNVWERQQHKIVRDLVSQLSQRNAEMVRMLFFEQPPLPYDEVAKRLGLARGSIGFIRGRVLDKLRKGLAAAGCDGGSF